MKDFVDDLCDCIDDLEEVIIHVESFRTQYWCKYQHVNLLLGSRFKELFQKERLQETLSTIKRYIKNANDA